MSGTDPRDRYRSHTSEVEEIVDRLCQLSHRLASVRADVERIAVLTRYRHALSSAVIALLKAECVMDAAVKSLDDAI